MSANARLITVKNTYILLHDKKWFTAYAYHRPNLPGVMRITGVRMAELPHPLLPMTSQLHFNTNKGFFRNVPVHHSIVIVSLTEMQFGKAVLQWQTIISLAHGWTCASLLKHTIMPFGGGWGGGQQAYWCWMVTARNCRCNSDTSCPHLEIREELRRCFLCRKGKWCCIDYFELLWKGVS